MSKKHCIVCAQYLPGETVMEFVNGGAIHTKCAKGAECADCGEKFDGLGNIDHKRFRGVLILRYTCQRCVWKAKLAQPEQLEPIEATA